MFDFFTDGGLGPIPDGSPGAGSLVPFPLEVYQTPILDLTKPNLGIELFPAKPGYVALSNLVEWVITQVTGTQTGVLSAQAGSDPAHRNLFNSQATQPSNATVNGANPPSRSGNQTLAFTVKLFPGAPVILDVTAGAVGTGGFTLNGFFVAYVFWMAVQQ